MAKNGPLSQIGAALKLPGAMLGAAQAKQRAKYAKDMLGARMLKNDTQGAAGAKRNERAMGVSASGNKIRSAKSYRTKIANAADRVFNK